MFTFPRDVFVLFSIRYSGSRSNTVTYLLNMRHDPWCPLACPRGQRDDSLATLAYGRSTQEVHLAQRSTPKRGERVRLRLDSRR